jgi:hypothetical protein
MRVVDPAALAQEIIPYITAAVGAYGASVLTRAEDTAAGATVSFGQRLIRRLMRGEPGSTSEITTAVSEFAGNPRDTDLRAAVAAAFRADPGLAAEIAAWHRPGDITISALGSHSVAAHTVNGTIITGDIHLGHE